MPWQYLDPVGLKDFRYEYDKSPNIQDLSKFARNQLKI
jgi:hypothetical protein